MIVASWRSSGVVSDQHPVRLAVAGGAGHRLLVFLAKRYTAYTQAFLGLAMAVAPGGGWLAAGGRGGWEPWLLGLAIGLWVGGFDVLYACQDLEFDRAQGLRSIPVRFGVALVLISRAMHVGTIVCMAALGGVPSVRSTRLGVAWWRCSIFEQSLVSATDLSQVKKAFDLNGWVVSCILVTALDVLKGRLIEPR